MNFRHESEAQQEISDKAFQTTALELKTNDNGVKISESKNI